MKHRLAHLDRISLLWENSRSSLSEKERRLWAAQHAKEIGYGGAPLVSQATGLSLSTLRRGLKELQNLNTDIDPFRSRKPGGGRKSIHQKLPNIRQAITSLMKPDYQDNPTSPFLWTTHNTRLLCRRLKLAGLSVSDTKLASLLHEHQYQNHYPQKRGRHPSSKDRDAQCRRIWMMAQKCVDAQMPLLFVDVKEHPLDDSLLKQAPPNSCLFPCENISHHKGWDFAAMKEHNTAWVLQALQTWWKDIGCGSYRSAKVITLVVNGYDKERKIEGLIDASPWQQALQQLAQNSGLSIRVRHLPPCTFRWNNILHKTTTYRVCEGRILAVTLYAIGLSNQPPVASSFWDSRQPPALLPTDKINIKRDKFHPEWNYWVGN